MSDIRRKPIFIQDQQLSRLVLLSEDGGDKLKHLRSQHGGEAWESRSEFEKFTKEQRQNYLRWKAVENRWELFSQFQSRDRTLLAVTAYAGIGKSMVLHQIDGLLSSVREGMDVVRVEFSDLPDDWEQYLHKPWKGGKPFLVRVLSDEFIKHTNCGDQLPTIDPENLPQWIQWVETKIRTGTFVLAIDSLDEYNAPDATEKAKQLRKLLMEVFPTLHCVVAGRPHAITQELWLSLFSDLSGTTGNSPRSDWEFMRVEMFNREQLERFLGKELADQLEVLEADIEFSPRNLESLRTLDETTRASIRSTADLYWHSIVRSLPRDNREGMGERLLHTNLSVNEILHMLSAVGITMALWHNDPRFPVNVNEGINEFGPHVPIRITKSESTGQLETNPSIVEVGGEALSSMHEFCRRVFERLLDVYPSWRDIDTKKQRSLVELRFEELVRLNSQYVEFGFLIERRANQVRWRNSTLRDFFASLWMSTCSSAVERDAFHRRIGSLKPWKSPEETLYLQSLMQWQINKGVEITVEREQLNFSFELIWQLICGMPLETARLAKGTDNSVRNIPWLRLINPLYMPVSDEVLHKTRPTELMYRAWPGLLMRAGFLRQLAWTEYDLLVATTTAQRFFDHTNSPNKLSVGIEVNDENAWRIVGGFLQQYPSLRGANDDRSRIISEDLEAHWCRCVFNPPLIINLGDPHYIYDNCHHEEVLQHGFSMSAYQVTNRLYKLFDPEHQNHCFETSHADPRCPAVNLNWFDAMMFCIWCHGYLPSEWEWEYACAPDTRKPYCDTPWNVDTQLSQLYAWTKENAWNKFHPVGMLRANDNGLFDTLGNAWEWCRNRYATEISAFAFSPVDLDSLDRSYRALRGGGINRKADEIHWCIRESDHPSQRLQGLRVSKVHHHVD